ncbi:hypothetical protein [Aquirhabdus sp.]|uniref:hypothetical protein n=1 Tax=Aquirhabdus sp. TaxID=2824160 RepID=UPI00396CF007
MMCIPKVARKAKALGKTQQKMRQKIIFLAPYDLTNNLYDGFNDKNLNIQIYQNNIYL